MELILQNSFVKIDFPVKLNVFRHFYPKKFAFFITQRKVKLQIKLLLTSNKHEYIVFDGNKREQINFQVVKFIKLIFVTFTNISIILFSFKNKKK